MDRDATYDINIGEWSPNPDPNSNDMKNGAWSVNPNLDAADECEGVVEDAHEQEQSEESPSDTTVPPAVASKPLPKSIKTTIGTYLPEKSERLQYAYILMRPGFLSDALQRLISTSALPPTEHAAAVDCWFDMQRSATALVTTVRADCAQQKDEEKYLESTGQTQLVPFTKNVQHVAIGITGFSRNGRKGRLRSIGKIMKYNKHCLGAICVNGAWCKIGEWTTLMPMKFTKPNGTEIPTEHELERDKVAKLNAFLWHMDYIEATRNEFNSRVQGAAEKMRGQPKPTEATTETETDTKTETADEKDEDTTPDSVSISETLFHSNNRNRYLHEEFKHFTRHEPSHNTIWTDASTLPRAPTQDVHPVHESTSDNDNVNNNGDNDSSSDSDSDSNSVKKPTSVKDMKRLKKFDPGYNVQGMNKLPKGRCFDCDADDSTCDYAVIIYCPCNMKSREGVELDTHYVFPGLGAYGILNVVYVGSDLKKCQTIGAVVRDVFDNAFQVDVVYCGPRVTLPITFSMMGQMYHEKKVPVLTHADQSSDLTGAISSAIEVDRDERDERQQS